MKRAGNRGFTLVELMIVVAIVAILAAVAYPSLTNHIARGKRTAAAAFIMSVAARQEQAMLNSRAYQSSVAALNMAVPQEVADNYSVTITLDAGPPPGFTVTATPTGAQATKDAKCGNLTYTQAGVKGASGPKGVAECWK